MESRRGVAMRTTVKDRQLRYYKSWSLGLDLIRLSDHITLLLLLHDPLWPCALATLTWQYSIVEFIELHPTGDKSWQFVCTASNALRAVSLVYACPDDDAGRELNFPFHSFNIATQCSNGARIRKATTKQTSGDLRSSLDTPANAGYTIQ